MKNYLILSNDLITINESIKNIIKNEKFSDADLIKYDLSEVFLEQVIEELNTYGLFSKRKVVVASSCLFLSGDKKRGQIEQNEELLVDYIAKSNPDCILILITEKLDERKKLSKLLRKAFNVIDKDISINDKIKSNLEDYKMDNKTISYLIKFLNNDNERILNEVNKLKLYKYPDKLITIKDIDEICIKELDENIFDLLNAIVSKKRKKAFEIYYELLNHGEDVIKIAIMVADHFRLLYKVKVLLKDGYSADRITSLLKIHPYRVRLAVESCFGYSDDTLISYLKQLGLIDINIKTGVSANNYGFELFLLNI